MELLKATVLFTIAAVVEIVGCYLPWLIIKQNKPLWLLLPAALSLALFAWLLTLHPSAAGRTYAAYGGIYIPVVFGALPTGGSAGPLPVPSPGVWACGARPRRSARPMARPKRIGEAPLGTWWM